MWRMDRELIVQLLPYSIVCVVVFAATQALNESERQALRNKMLTMEERNKIERTAMMVRTALWMVAILACIISFVRS